MHVLLLNLDLSLAIFQLLNRKFWIELPFISPHSVHSFRDLRHLLSISALDAKDIYNRMSFFADLLHFPISRMSDPGKRFKILCLQFVKLQGCGFSALGRCFA